MPTIKLVVAIVMGILAGVLGFIFGTVFQIQSPGIWITVGVSAAVGFLGSFFSRDK